jgi:secreted trypsin-like serine protease
VRSSYSADVLNDIAVVRLSGSPPNGTAVILAISSTDASAGETVTISGYGFDEEASLVCAVVGGDECPALPEELLQADIEVLSTTECQQTWEDVTSSQNCVKDYTGSQGACRGDSGGPMFRSNGTVVGLASYSGSDCSLSYLSVHTRVSAFRSWIQSTTGI